jgi:hypothetical protein
MCVFQCRKRVNEEWDYNGPCKATIKTEQAACKVFDDKRLECVGADGCTFAADSTGETLGDGFNAGSGGGEAGQTLECWLVGSHDSGSEGSLFEFSKRCKNAAKKDDGTETCEVVKLEAAGAIDETYACERLGCQQDLDELACLNRECEYKAFTVCNAVNDVDKDECALETDCGGNAKCRQDDTSVCLEVDLGGAGGNDEGPDDSCYGFQPLFDADGVPVNRNGIMLNDEGKTLGEWCAEDTDKDKVSGGFIFTRFAFAFASSCTVWSLARRILKYTPAAGNRTLRCYPAQCQRYDSRIDQSLENAPLSATHHKIMYDCAVFTPLRQHVGRQLGVRLHSR